MSKLPKNIKNDDPEVDVLIVGAGLSGLTSAYKLFKKQPSLKILIVESSDRIGGQLRTPIYGVGAGMWITPDHYHIINLCKQLNVESMNKYPLKRFSKRCWDIDNLNFVERFELHRFIQEIDIKCLQYRPGKFRIDRNETNMESFLRSKLFFENTRQFVRFWIKMLTGVDPCHVTVTEFMSLCQSFGDFTNVINLFTLNDPKLKGIDTEELLEKILGQIKSIQIVTSTKIVEIVHYSDSVALFDSRGYVLRTSVLILAIPWINILRIRIYPTIPSEFKTPFDEGDKFLVTAFLATYRESYWSKKNRLGNLFSSYYQMVGFETLPTGFYGYMLHEDNISHITRDLILNRLCKCFGQEMLIPNEWKISRFEKDILLGLPKTTPCNRIIWSSAGTATAFRGQLSGAVQSGFRAAFAALLILRPQIVNWMDIDEIQRASAVYRRVSNFELFRSSFNLYNTSCYIVIIASALTFYRAISKLMNLIKK